MKRRVLVACEFSGVVRDAFAEWGWDAWSCDLYPSERPGNHYTGDVFDILNWLPAQRPWDLLIAHPPCTFLCNSGVRWLSTQPKRFAKMKEAARFFKRLWDAPVEHICIENPIMHSYGKIEIFGSKEAGKPHCTIQPWQHGHGEVKATCLWLKNLPPLKPSRIVSGRTPRVHHASPGPERWKERSRTLQGVADAMAEQFTLYINRLQTV